MAVDEIRRELRPACNAVPVIITTAQDRIAIRIEGLNSGADDYLVKPFDLTEMGARIAAVARRYGGNPTPDLRRRAELSSWKSLYFQSAAG